LLQKIIYKLKSLLPACCDSIPLYTAVPNHNTERFGRWCVTKYMTVNLDIISVSSHTRERLLYVVDLSLDFSTLSLEEGNSCSFIIRVRIVLCGDTLHSCDCHLKPDTLYHILWGRYLYSCCRQNTNSWQTLLEEAQIYIVLVSQFCEVLFENYMCFRILIL
jgi:hypothetical protein